MTKLAVWFLFGIMMLVIIFRNFYNKKDVIRIYKLVKEVILQKELNVNDPDTFTVTDVNIRSLVPDPALEASSKARAEMENKIAQKKLEQEQAKEEASRLQIEAEGQVKANKIISDSLTPDLIRFREIEAMRQFAGQGTHTVVFGNDKAQPLINTPTK